MRRRKGNKQRKILVISFIGLLFIMTVGYAAFQTNLNISAKGNFIKQIAADFLKRKVVNSGDGLYADSNETGRYIYRGLNPNNYIKFNNELWRIVSIESDETLRIMKNNTIGNMAIDSNNLRTTGYCSLGKMHGTCNAWAKMDNYFNGVLEGNVDKDAELNTYLNTTYYNSIVSKDVMQQGIFYIGAVELYNSSLPEAINQEKTFSWKGNIALLSITEYARASLNCDTIFKAYTYQCVDDNWIYKAAVANTDFTWLISPFIGEYVVANYNIVPKGYNRIGDFNWSVKTYGVMPVTHLKSNITLLGDGTETSPYVIE